MVEAAFCTPVFLLLLFSVLEFSIYLQSIISLSSTVSSATRKASVLGNEIDTDFQIIQAVKKDMRVASRGQVKVLVVFNAGVANATNPAAAEVPAFCSQPGVANPQSKNSTTAACNAYTVATDFAVTDSKQFACTGSGTGYGTRSNGYCPTSRRNVVAGAGPDYVGIYVRLEHTFLTGFFGSARTVDQQMITRLEPQALA